MQLSVIILNYNVRFFLEQCVLSVQKALKNIDSEIIVVDNNSSDDSCAMMKSLFPTLKLIENKENIGFPKGNNIGVANAKGEYICILNPDTVVAEDTFTKILNTENWKLNTGIIGCKLIILNYQKYEFLTIFIVSCLIPQDFFDCSKKKSTQLKKSLPLFYKIMLFV